MKKNKVLALGLCSILLLSAAFTGCSNDSSNDSSSSSTPANQPANGGNNGGANNGGTNNGTNNGATNNGGSTTIPVATLTAAKVAEFQTAITNAEAGTTVNLAAGTVPADSKISIGKALTVDGKGVEGLTVEVASSVSSSVSLKNFKNATIKITAPAVSSSIRAARGADAPAAATAAVDDEELQSFKKFGDGALPLFLEGCSIEKFEAADDVALYLEKGEEKTEIKELELKKGVEDFTFIELDEKETSLDSKSKVEKLSIEDDGVEKINLIGGTFGAVDFADNFAGEIDFKYDKEFSDQFEKKDFLKEEFIEAKDVAIAEDKSAGSNIYKFTMTRSEFDKLNGNLDVLFLTDAQVEAIKNSASTGSIDYMDLMTIETPAYDMSLMGAFTVEKESDGSIAEGLHAVYGASEVYYDYTKTIRGEFFQLNKMVRIEKYMTYSKEAVIIQVGKDEVNLFVDKGAVRKSDLLLCSGYGRDDTRDIGGTSEGGTKLSNISLEGYTPYFALNLDQLFNTMGSDAYNLLSNKKSLTQNTIEVPTANKTAFVRVYKPFEMEKTTADAYPSVAVVTYPDITVPNVKLKVNYYDEALEFVRTSTEIRENINPLLDDYEYYFDNKFEDMVCITGAEVNWNDIYAGKNFTDKSDVTIYARPRRNIKIIKDASCGNLIIERLSQLKFSSTGISSLEFNDLSFQVYKTYDSATGAYSDPVTSLKDIPNDVDKEIKLYLVVPYVKLYLAGKESGTEPVFASILWKTQLSQTLDYYKSTVISDANKYAIADIQKADNGTPVYTIKPAVTIKSDIHDTEPVTTTFADLYSLVTKSNKKYYISEFSNGSTVYNECTKAKLDSLLQTLMFEGGYTVFVTPPDTTKLSIVYLNYDATSSVPVERQNIIDGWNSNYQLWTFYSDAAKKNTLSLDDVKKLAENTTVYLYSGKVYYQCGNSKGLMSKADIVDIYNGKDFFADEAKTTPLSKAELAALPELAVNIADIPDDTAVQVFVADKE